MQLSQYTKALCDETRLRILMLLLSNEELCVCQFTAVLQLSQPKISRHLAILREAELLQDRKEGLWVYYRLASSLPEWVLNNLQSLHIAAQQQTPFQQDHKLIEKTTPKDVSSCHSKE